MARLHSVPRSAIVLGIAGLIPFIGFAALSVSGSDGGLGNIGLSPRTILSAYGAVIASFLGGIRWGAAAARGSGNGDYFIAIVPSLVAWAAMAVPAPWDLRILGVLVLAWGLVDQDLTRRGLAPPWLARLRLVLSGVAGAALLVAASLTAEAAPKRLRNSASTASRRCELRKQSRGAGRLEPWRCWFASLHSQWRRGFGGSRRFIAIRGDSPPDPVSDLSIRRPSPP